MLKLVDVNKVTNRMAKNCLISKNPSDMYPFCWPHKHKSGYKIKTDEPMRIREKMCLNQLGPKENPYNDSVWTTATKSQLIPVTNIHRTKVLQEKIAPNDKQEMFRKPKYTSKHMTGSEFQFSKDFLKLLREPTTEELKDDIQKKDSRKSNSWGKILGHRILSSCDIISQTAKSGTKWYTFSRVRSSNQRILENVFPKHNDFKITNLKKTKGITSVVAFKHHREVNFSHFQ